MRYITSSLLAIGIGFSASAQVTPTKFDEVLTYVNRMYVDDVEKDKLIDDAIVAMLEKLDPHSTFISKEDVDDANQSINGSFVGIGIRFQILKDTLIVVETISGGPSEKLGILAGDKIVRIENENVAGVGLKNSAVREKLMGEKGTKVKVEILRKNIQSPIDFTITRDKIPVFSIDASYMVNDKIGYIKLNSFSRTTTDEIDQALSALKKMGMKDLILDLQGNGGGLLTAAQELADQFLTDDKLIVYSEGRARPRHDYNAGTKKSFEKGRLIILTDEYSASASEIVSGAIQDWDRGLIVGRRTYGKGLVQQPIDLSDGSQIRLTIARYFTPTGRFIQKPYENVDEYRNDLLTRYENGEFYHADSIKLNDSLVHETLIKKRKVYGGGGIMPDYFVPVDTLAITDYYRTVVRSGAINTFVLEYVDKNRAKLAKDYPTFNAFKQKHVISKEFMDDFIAYFEKENPEEKFNEAEFETSKELFELRLKASLAQDLWGIGGYYEISNSSNEALQKAIQLLTDGTYDKAGLVN